MARRPRDLDTSEWFHVFNRGHDRQDVFSLDGDRELFLALLGDTVEATGVAVHAYALMTNHIHALVHAADRSLPDFMKLLCGRYGAAYNQRTNRSGAVFGGRFGSVPIERDDHLLIAARYVERNPIAIVGEAALPNYRYSSLGSYLGVRPTPSWLTTSLIGEQMDPDHYHRFVLDAHPSDRLPLGELSALSPVSPAHVLDLVGEMTGVDPAIRSGPSRNLAAAISLELRTATVPTLATLFNISQPAVRQAARRGRISVDTDGAARSVRDRVVDLLHRAA